MNTTARAQPILLCLILLSVSNISNAHRGAKRVLKSDTIALHLDVPDDFGKTHFIVGFPEDELEKHRAQKKEKPVIASADQPIDLLCDGCIKKVFFAPDDNIQKILLHLIKGEKESIRMTAYSFTDGDVAQALINAHDRGVHVEIIADPGCMLDRFGKVPMIKDHDIVVFIYNPNHLNNDKKNLTSSIMHHKFIIFGKNVSGKSILWTGSFNWTKSAHRRNQENVVMLDDKQVVDTYAHHFERLKERCNPVKPKNTVVAKGANKVPVNILLSKKGTLFENNEVRA